jgi:branched-chain amino acid transport system substrate-binding protein
MSGPKVLSIVHNLINSRNISGITGNFSNVAMLTMAPILQKSQVVAMHTAAMDDEILAAGKGWIFSTNTRVRDEASQLASYAWRSGARKVAIVTIETNFGQGYRNHFKVAFEKLGGLIVADETYQLGDVDYRTQLTRVRSKSPDIIFAATFGHFLGLTLRQGRELGISAPFISVYESEDPSVVEAAGRHADGLRYFVSYAPIVDKETLEIRRELTQRLGREPSTFSLNAYDATMLLTNAVGNCRGAAQCVADSLHRIKNYNGISGSLSIGVDGAAERSFYLREVVRGNFVSVQ